MEGGRWSKKQSLVDVICERPLTAFSIWFWTKKYKLHPVVAIEDLFKFDNK